MKKYHINDSKKLQKLLKNSKNIATSNKIMEYMFEDLNTLSENINKSIEIPFACAKGCQHCCDKVLIQITEPEAMYIYTYLKSVLEPQELNQFFEQIQKNTIETQHITDMTEYAKLNIPCIFLNQGVCSIYDIRPFICREYHSFSLEACLNLQNLFSTKIRDDYYRIFHQYQHLYTNNKLSISSIKFNEILLEIHQNKSFMTDYFKSSRK